MSVFSIHSQLNDKISTFRLVWFGLFSQPSDDISHNEVSQCKSSTMTGSEEALSPGPEG